MDSNTDWAELAAMPEMYYTAWCSLFEALHLKRGESLLIRDGTSSLGIASIQFAVKMGVIVAATTRSEEKRELLKAFGADIVLIDDDALGEQVEKSLTGGVYKVLELIGTTTPSSKVLKPGGTLCMSGILGGSWEIANFASMDFIPSGSYFTIYDSQNVRATSLEAMFQFLSEHRIHPPIAKIFICRRLLRHML